MESLLHYYYKLSWEHHWIWMTVSQCMRLNTTQHHWMLETMSDLIRELCSRNTSTQYCLLLAVPSWEMYVCTCIYCTTACLCHWIIFLTVAKLLPVWYSCAGFTMLSAGGLGCDIHILQGWRQDKILTEKCSRFNKTLNLLPSLCSTCMFVVLGLIYDAEVSSFHTHTQ